MKQAADLARRFLSLADRDLRAFEKLVPDREIADEVIGFHAQQAIEKCLKAVLVSNGVEFRRVHDLELLLELLDDHRIAPPPDTAAIQELNPFAVLLRYDFLGHPAPEPRRLPPGRLDNGSLLEIRSPEPPATSPAPRPRQSRPPPRALISLRAAPRTADKR